MARKAHKSSFSATIRGILVVCVLVLTGCAQGGGGDQVEFEAFLNDVDISTSEPSDPIKLVDSEPASLQLNLENVSDDPLTVRYIRFEGEVLDMIFLTYDTAVRVDLQPGESEELPPVTLDFYDLGGQASGYLRGHVQLYDGDRELLGSEQVFLEADGEGFSTLSWFNLLLLLATGAGLGWNLLRLSQRRLPGNRFVRALRFLAVGAGAGLTLAVAFSTLRLWPLGTVAWVLFTVIGAVAGYAIGFILPGADDDVIDVLDEQDVLDAVVDEDADSVLTGDGRDTLKRDD